jgi:hypothetical protein
MFRVVPSADTLAVFKFPSSYSTRFVHAMNDSRKFVSTFLGSDYAGLSSGIYFVHIGSEELNSQVSEAVDEYNSQSRAMPYFTPLSFSSAQAGSDLERVSIPSSSYVVAGLLRNSLERKIASFEGKKPIGENIRVCEKKKLNTSLCPEFFSVRKCYSVWFQHDIEESQEQKIYLIIDLTYSMSSNLELPLIIRKIEQSGRNVSELKGKFVSAEKQLSPNQKIRFIGNISNVSEDKQKFGVVYHGADGSLIEEEFPTGSLTLNLSYSREYVEELIPCLNQLEAWRWQENHKWPQKKIEQIKEGVRGFLKGELFTSVSIGSVTFDLEAEPTFVD